MAAAGAEFSDALVAETAAAAAVELLPEGDDRQHEPDPGELRRFLVACGGSSGKAGHVYACSQQWRAEEGIDGLLEESGGTEAEAAIRRYLQYIDGLTDVEGRPAAVWRAGRVPVRAMLHEFGAEPVLRNHVYLKERALKAARAAGHVTHVLIIDMFGMGLHTLDSEGLATLQRGVHYEQKHYPETQHKIIIVRAPWLFGAFWRIVNPWLSEGDRAKVCMILCSVARRACASVMAFIARMVGWL